MLTGNVELLSPEQRELLEKQEHLSVLETALADRELALQTLDAELRSFHALYLRRVGVKFADRDRLDALIAEAVAQSRPADPMSRQAADAARSRAQETAAAVDTPVVASQGGGFKPSDKLKALYRDMAKRVHPDLAPNEASRTRRTQLMAEANLAYGAGDEARLRALLADWEASPDVVEGSGVAADLVRTIRKIHQVKRRLMQIDDEIAELMRSDLSKLKNEVDAAQGDGRDLLGEMVVALEAEIATLERRWREVCRKRGAL